MRAFFLVLFLGFGVPLQAQWTHRYPKLDGYGHQVYLEGYELPTMNAGPTGPAVSPDGSRVAFSARGWIWILDLGTGRATRETSGRHMDFRPSWSPDGQKIAFVRDDSEDTWIVIRNLPDGTEHSINSPALDLDPIFDTEGALIYSSASGGTLDLYSTDLDTLVSESGIELEPSLSKDGSTLVYVHKDFVMDRIVARDRSSGSEVVIAERAIMAQTQPDVSPDGKMVVYNWPTEDGYELRLATIARPGSWLRLTSGTRGLPLAPEFSPDGNWIWFTEPDSDEVMRLYRIPSAGGEPEEISIEAWDWGEPMGTLRVTTQIDSTQASARLSIVDQSGHPVVPISGHAQFGLQDGRVFFYSPGVIDVLVPTGMVTVSAVQGLTTPEVTQTVRVTAEYKTEATLALEPVWNPRRSGYISADHHFHLNYGGPYRLQPDDLPLMTAGEGIDFATPMVANLHNRFEDRHLFGWERIEEHPWIQFTQEVRSHFLGHVGLLDTETLFWPWIWGPFYQVYGEDDRPNSEALDHAHREGGTGGYVHPIVDREPFLSENLGSAPVMLTVDGILGNMDWLEVACLWTDELGTSEVWYRFLNLGVPIVLEAGSDVMNNFYRTMPIGAARIYVQTGSDVSMDAYWKAFREGRSFVTTGPMIEFAVDSSMAGETVTGGRSTRFRLDLASATVVDSVEILINGNVVWSDAGLSTPGVRSYQGTVELPEGGWVAARAHGGRPGWPVMDSYPFAHTGVVWIDHVGSTDPGSKRAAARELMPLLSVAAEQVRRAYGETPTPRILREFELAREKLNGVE